MGIFFHVSAQNLLLLQEVFLYSGETVFLYENSVLW